MSALAGYWSFDGRPDTAQRCRRMLAAQEVYGPHGSADWDGGEIALGRRLYDTLPEDAHDRQPLTGGGGRYTLVADVRLDNRDALVGDLQIHPSDAAYLSDAAILLAAWERWGEDVFDHLYGDYAFALWDSVERRLLLARDAIGARPLHYHLGDGFMAFASMPKGLHALPEVPYGPDEERAAELLALLPEHGPRSFFKDVSRVEAGHVVILTRTGAARRRHWRPSPEPLRLRGRGEYEEAARHHLDMAVQSRLRGAGSRVGAHLSGGLDSSAVAATAARLMAPSGGQVLAFTSVPRKGYDGATPPSQIGDEGSLAAATAALYPNMEQVLVRPDGRGILDSLDRDFFLFERPLNNTCNQRWMNTINAEAGRRGVNVLLTGALGNCSLSYEGWQLLPELAARGRWLRLAQEGRALVKAGRASWPGVVAAGFGPWIPDGPWRALKRLGQAFQGDVDDYSALNPARRRALDMDARASERGLDFLYRPRRNAVEYRLWVLGRVDLGNSNKGVLGGWGVDLRDPTADRRLLEFCLSLPTEAFLADGVPRALARGALADRLPTAVLGEHRRGKQAADWHEGFTASRDRVREEVERLEEVPAAATALDLARMRRLIDEWPTEGWDTAPVESAYRLALLRGVTSGYFLRKASRSNA